MNTLPGRAEGHLLGIVLVILSTLAFSLAGILTKAIAADTWTILTWRGLVGGLLIAAYAGWLGRRKPLSQRFRLGWRGWLLATVGSLSSIAFIAAFKQTYVANVALIYATAPFLAAALGWLVMRERVRQRTLAAALVSCLGIAVIFSGGLQVGSLTGDALALAMTFGSALYMVLIRKFADTPVVLAGGAAGLQLFAAGWLVVDPLAVSRHDALLLVLFGLAFAVAVVLWTEGTRRIPAAESGLLGCAETPFAALLAWWLLAELPPAASFLGGAVVLAAVLIHAGWDMRSGYVLRRQAKLRT
ncbi:DMT family transporter [Pelagibius sp. 7325]|uniref:DMT family transporter n=1 Tax=Pelagibius sp. 7325 TaxID=3131994 RepID=UPI0030ECD61C